MKKLLILILGIILGILISNYYDINLIDKQSGANEDIIENSSSAQSKSETSPTAKPKSIDGLTLFEKRGEMMPDESYKIYKTIDDSHAIARAPATPGFEFYHGMEVLIIGDDNSSFYDDLIIRAGSDKRFYRVGTYKYSINTIPAVSLQSVD